MRFLVKYATTFRLTFARGTGTYLQPDEWPPAIIPKPVRMPKEVWKPGDVQK